LKGVLIIWKDVENYRFIKKFRTLEEGKRLTGLAEYVYLKEKEKHA